MSRGWAQAGLCRRAAVEALDWRMDGHVVSSGSGVRCGTTRCISALPILCAAPSDIPLVPPQPQLSHCARRSLLAARCRARCRSLANAQ